MRDTRPETPSAGMLFFYYDDVDVAFHWYRSVLGLECVMKERWVTVLRLTGGSYLGLVSAADGTQQPVRGDNKGVLISFEVTDLKCWYETLKARDDVAFIRDMGTGPHGIIDMFQIRDPGGYPVELFAWRNGPLLADRSGLA